MTSNQYVDYSSVRVLEEIDSVLPDHGAASDLLQSIIGAEPLSTFVVDRLGLLLKSRLVQDSEAEGVSLRDMDLGESIRDVANRIVDDFLTLPWRYAFLFELPARAVEPLLPDQVDEFPLADEMVLIRWTADQDTAYPVPDQDEPGAIGLSLGLFGPPRPTDGGYYFRTVHSGFIPEFGSSPAVDEAERALRAICGIGFAMRVWKRGWREGLATLLGSSRAHVLIWVEDGEGWSYTTPRTLATEVGEAVSRLQIERFEGVSDRVASVMAVKQFTKSRILFGSEEGRTITRACRWLFDSYVGSNELLSFIQATISAEILLGDKAISDITGLTELLANRCAYLVGQTRQQREEVLADFRDIYKTRSRIVHRGLDQLSADDENQLWTLRWLCTRIIQRELDLLTPQE